MTADHRNNCPVERCDRPRHEDRAVCAVHANQLRQDLAELPSVYVALERALAPYASGFVSGGGSAPALPYNLAAAEARSNIRAVLVGWIRDLEADPGRHPADTVPAMARWLYARHHRLVTHPAAEEIVREIDQVRRAGDRAVLGPVPREPLGTCDTEGCQEGLSAAPGRPFVTCRVCGATYDVEARKSAMKAHLRDQLLTAAEIADMARYFGDVADRDRTRNLVKVWGHRGVITAKAHDEAGHPRYRFGEVLDRLADLQARRTG